MPRLKLSTIPKTLSTHLFSPTLTSFLPSPSTATSTTGPPTYTAPPTTSFQIISDLHLEASQTPPNTYETFHIPPRAPYLLLAGDIGLLTPSHYPRYLHFLAAHVHKFRQIFLILGNHEFYHQSRDEALRAAARLESEQVLEGRVQVLYRRVAEVSVRVGKEEEEEEVVCILGATLNTHVPEEAAAEVAARVQDFRMIKGWSVDAHNRAFREDVEWLKAAVAGLRRGRKAVIVTHHAPVVGGTSKSVFEGSSVTSAFATNVVGEVLAAGGGGGESVGTWVFGHTHFSVDFWVKWKRGRVRLVANQRGYFGEEEAGFDVGLVVGV